MRDDSESEFYADSSAAHGNEVRRAAETFLVDVPDIDALFLKKLAYARKSLANTRTSSADLLHHERLELFEWFYKQYVEQHSNVLKKSLPTLFNHKAPSATQIVSIVFNGNVRNFSRNLIRSFDYLYFYAKQRPDFKAAQESVERIESLSRINDLIFEGSLLSGNNYMRINADNRAEGRWCPNFFEFLETSERKLPRQADSS